MKNRLLIALVLLIPTAAFAQDHLPPQAEEEQAYCRYIQEQGNASAILLRTPSAEAGVTQPSTGTAPQTYIGLTGSLNDLRKAHLIDRVAKDSCRLFVTTVDATESIKYAVLSLEREATRHRIDALNMGIRKLDILITQNNKLLESGNTTKLSLYELEATRLRFITERSTLQMQVVSLYIPGISSTPIWQQVEEKQTQEKANQESLAKLAKQNNWDFRWQAGVHHTISGIGPVTNPGGQSSGFYLGFQATYNLGSRKANKQIDASARDYVEYKRLAEDDVVAGADHIQAVVLDEIMAADKKLVQISEQRKTLDANIVIVKQANTSTAQTFLNQLDADDVTLQVELADTRYRRQQLTDYLTHNFRPSPTTEAGSVSLTFDDGYQSAYVASLPILEKAGMKGTYYIITSYLGKSATYMTSDEVKDIAARGHEVGSHTIHHKHLPTMTLAEQEAEIGGSLQDFAALGIKPSTLAYPFGERNGDSLTAVRAAGFKAARTVDPNAPTGDNLQLASFSLTNRTSIGELKVAIDNARREGTWLILTFHRIDEDNDISVSHELLQWVVDYLRQTKTKVITVEGGVPAPMQPAPRVVAPAARGPIF